MTSRAILVVPCFNEAARLEPGELLRLVELTGTKLLLVNDGSTDETSALLARLCAASEGRATQLDLQRNQGKAEAIRRGVVEALRQDPPLVGYFDADLATPVEELARLMKEIESDRAEVVIGSRVALVGKRIERSYARHLLGRAFATAASASLGLVIYDTQCGAKLFRNTPTVRAAFGSPFRSDWAFDVELLGRLLYPQDEALLALNEQQIVELPLETWRHRAGSKLRPKDMVRAALDLAWVGLDLRRRPSWRRTAHLRRSVF